LIPACLINYEDASAAYRRFPKTVRPQRPPKLPTEDLFIQDHVVVDDATHEASPLGIPSSDPPFTSDEARIAADRRGRSVAVAAKPRRARRAFCRPV
jgi:hypothetical protein